MQVLIAFSSAFALSHCLFLALYCGRTSARQPALRWLLGLLLSLAVRLSKSVFLVLGANLPPLVPAVGLVGMTTMGPCLWLYVRGGLRPQQPLTRLDMTHFGASVLVAGWQLFAPSDEVIWGQYAAAALHMAVYMGVTVGAIRGAATADTPLRRPVREWLARLLVSVGLLWLVFVGQLFAPGPAAYLVITTVAALVLYGISYWGLRHARVLTLGFVIKASPAAEQLGEVGQQIRQALVEEGLYKDATLTLPKLAKRLKLPAHHLSKLVNRLFSQTFSELLTECRIRAVTDQLTNPAFAHLSLEAIAADCGFNSVSTFYATFKKVHHLTPAEYRRRHSLAAGPVAPPGS